MWNTDKEYMAGLRHITTKWLAISTHYDSDMGFGAGHYSKLLNDIIS